MRQGRKTSAEQVVLKLRPIEVQTAHGKSLALAWRAWRSPARRRRSPSRRIDSLGVTEALADAMCLHGIPEHIRCGKGPEMTAKAHVRYVQVAAAGSDDWGGGDPATDETPDEAAGRTPIRYDESVDLVDAFHPQTILAYDLNGNPLPVGNGAPLRLRVERQLDCKMAKYVLRIEVVEALAGIGGGPEGYAHIRDDRRRCFGGSANRDRPHPWMGLGAERPVPAAAREPAPAPFGRSG